MKIKYDPEADVLILILRDVPPVDAVEEEGGVIISYGEDNKPVSVEFLNASSHNIIDNNELNITLQTSKTASLL
ncbi:hypothetical protein DESAMIL20_876 [Desulfurella amilsii]|uniref:DUF2283 domain-containing protein n=1 Tax=Desulfurella amilsii TaxID=1562698 RepID=A0A1X4XUV9_9BACT|nr:DUF2283 domain-containing protein [Desulfurella amilsii]OSS41323.1 hypothetical protein DESAMIL20_876 [Desulfurella amilsii]